NGGLPGLAEPGSSPPVQDSYEDQELSGRHKLFRGWKLSLPARTFQPPRGRLLGLLTPIAHLMSASSKPGDSGYTSEHLPRIIAIDSREQHGQRGEQRDRSHHLDR